jgi:hypothetical protein
MPRTFPCRLYATPMVPSDAARLVERVARILQAEADRMQREVNRLNNRKLVPRAKAEELLRVDDMRIPQVVTPADAKPMGRPRKAEKAEV